MILLPAALTNLIDLIGVTPALRQPFSIPPGQLPGRGQRCLRHGSTLLGSERALRLTRVCRDLGVKAFPVGRMAGFLGPFDKAFVLAGFFGASSARATFTM